MSGIEEVPRADVPATTAEAHAPVPAADTTSAPAHATEHKEEHKPGFLHKVKDVLTGVHHSEHSHGEKLDAAAMTPEERTGTNLAAKQEMGLTDPASAEGYGTGSALTSVAGGPGMNVPRSL